MVSGTIVHVSFEKVAGNDVLKENRIPTEFFMNQPFAKRLNGSLCPPLSGSKNSLREVGEYRLMDHTIKPSEA